VNPLEERLTEDLAAAADAADPVPPTLGSVMTSARRQQRRRRLRYAGAVAAVALPLAAIGVVELMGQDGEDHVVSPAASSTSVTTPPTTPSTTSTPTTTLPGGAAAPRTHTTTTTTAPPASSGIVLAADGLGVARLGQSADTVVAALSAELGKPTKDETTALGYCDPANGQAFAQERVVEWGDDNLAVVFFGNPGKTFVFRFWTVDGSSRLATAAGSHVGDSLAKWKVTYGDKLTTSPYSVAEEVYVVTVNLPRGDLTGRASQGPPIKVISLGAGTGCLNWD
jgi:hypothetical protein